MDDFARVISERLHILQAQKADLLGRIMRVEVAVEELTALLGQAQGRPAPIPDPAGTVPSTALPTVDSASSGVVLSPKTKTPVLSGEDTLKAMRGRK